MNIKTRHRLEGMIQKMRDRFTELGGAQNADLRGFDDGRDMGERESKNTKRFSCRSQCFDQPSPY